jgi:hypothetical protein
MEPGISFPFSDEPAARPCAEPAESRPQSHSMLFEIYYILRATRMSRSSKWSLSFRYFDYSSVSIYRFSHLYYTYRNFRLHFHHINIIWWRKQTGKLLIMQVYLFSCCILTLLCPDTLLSTVHKDNEVMSFTQCERSSFVQNSWRNYGMICFRK